MPPFFAFEREREGEVVPSARGYARDAAGRLPLRAEKLRDDAPSRSTVVPPRTVRVPPA